ncbi:hypothetical protein [Salimicrobium halophilum]|uniref:Uncharacterized protein n=1 Tax=Salimicrobium halophilum TaxID=86666 RepID=A0A1G8R8T9_9BACI|nr:hypothetical protein [Salimicrobium halophilum]SDJ13454.1 hypothetical protein SAMN04490247_0899 [Salimicrobium halophilum]
MMERLLRFGVAIIIFFLLWQVMAYAWNLFVPLNYKTNLLGVIFVMPLMVLVSFIGSHLFIERLRRWFKQGGRI